MLREEVLMTAPEALEIMVTAIGIMLNPKRLFHCGGIPFNYQKLSDEMTIGEVSS